MGKITRTYVFTGGTKAKAAEVNTELDTVHGAINGALDDENIAAAADIAESKIADISGTDVAARTESNPGNSSVPNKATNLQLELEKMRWKIRENGVGRAAFFIDDDNVTYGCGWQERAVIGENLLKNSSFEYYTDSAGSPTDAPDGWVIEGTPATLTTQTTAVTEGTGNDVAVIADAADEGIKQTVSNVKASTYYLVGCRLKALSGTAKLVTSGGLAAGNKYQNLSLTTTSGTYSTVCGVIITDATPTAIEVQILAAANTDSIKADHAFMYELGDSRLGEDRSTPFIVTGSGNTLHRNPDTTPATITPTNTGTYCTVSVTTPSDQPCYIEVTGVLCLSVGSGRSPNEYTIKLDHNDAGDGWATSYAIDGLLGIGNGGAGIALPGMIPIHYVLESPGLGENHQFRIEVANNAGSAPNDNIFINQWTAGFPPATAESSLTAIVRPKI